MQTELSSRASGAMSAVIAAMEIEGIQGKPVLHRDNDSVVFWIGNRLVAKACIGAARSDLAREAAVLQSIEPLGLPVVRLAKGHSFPTAVDEWSVLFTQRISTVDRSVGVSELLQSLERLHRELRYPMAASDLPDWSEIPMGAEMCRQSNPFEGAEHLLMQKVYEVVVLPALSESHAGDVLHGDVDFDQAVPTSDGIVWIDFATTCRGPIEWDLAAFDDPAAYGHFDVHRWNELRAVHSWCVASWCNRRDVDNSSRQAARQRHLNRLSEAYG